MEILKYRDVGVNKFLFPYNRFKTPSACVVTPIYATIISSVLWNYSSLEEILAVTDDLYRTTIVALKLKPNSKFPLNCIHPTFYISDYKVTIFIGSNYPKGYVGEIRDKKNNPEAISLVTSIVAENVGLVVLCDDKAVALWKMEEDFYAFSPDGVNKHQDLPILAKSKEITSILRFILQNASGNYALYSIKLLSKLQIKNSLAEIIKDTETRIDECRKSLATEDVDEAEQPLEKTQPAPAATAAAAASGPEKLNLTNDIQQVPVAFNPDYNYISDVRGILRGPSYVKEPEKLFHTIIACALYLHHIPSYIWASESLGEILKLGRNIYDSNEDQEDEVELQAKIEYPISFGRNRLNIDFEKVIYGEITTQKPEVLPITMGIRKFFEFYDTGIIQGPQMVLIWQERGYFFYYDPKERDQMGRKWTRALSDDDKKGASCVQWFQNPNDLADSYLNTIAFKHRRDAYKIIYLKIYEEKVLEVAEDWEDWVGFGPDMWALVGKQNICHYIGKTLNENGEEQDDMSIEAKSFGMAIGCLIFSIIKEEDMWLDETIEEIFGFGVDFMKATLSESEIKNDFKLSDVKPTTIVGDKRIVMIFYDCLISGMMRLDSNNPEAKEGLNDIKLVDGKSY